MRVQRFEPNPVTMEYKLFGCSASAGTNSGRHLGLISSFRTITTIKIVPKLDLRFLIFAI